MRVLIPRTPKELTRFACWIPHNRITSYPAIQHLNKLIANYGQGALTGICQIPRAKDKARLHKGALWLVRVTPEPLKYYGTSSLRSSLGRSSALPRLVPRHG